MESRAFCDASSVGGPGAGRVSVPAKSVELRTRGLRVHSLLQTMRGTGTPLKDKEFRC